MHAPGPSRWDRADIASEAGNPGGPRLDAAASRVATYVALRRVIVPYLASGAFWNSGQQIRGPDDDASNSSVAVASNQMSEMFVSPVSVTQRKMASGNSDRRA